MKHRRKRGVSSAVNLNSVIVPMLDMTFQILFFLILSFKAHTAEEGKIDIRLPASGEAKAKQPDMVDPTIPTDQELDLPSNRTVMLKSLPNGNLREILVKSLQGGEQSMRPDPAELAHYLKQTADEGKDNIKIEAESKVKYSLIIDVMDVCKRAGYKNVDFCQPPDLNN
jgi:biopolymer transport protein ExbD